MSRRLAGCMWRCSSAAGRRCSPAMRANGLAPDSRLKALALRPAESQTHTGLTACWLQQRRLLSDRSSSASISRPVDNESDGSGANTAEPAEDSNHIPGHYAMSFTCARCETKMVKVMSKQAYHNGVVIIQCTGCDAKHLIADNLGWFNKDGSSRNVEQVLAEKGQSVQRIDLASGDVEFRVVRHDERDGEAEAEDVTAADDGHKSS